MITAVFPSWATSSTTLKTGDTWVQLICWGLLTTDVQMLAYRSWEACCILPWRCLFSLGYLIFFVSLSVLQVWCSSVILTFINDDLLSCDTRVSLISAPRTQNRDWLLLEIFLARAASQWCVLLLDLLVCFFLDGACDALGIRHVKVRWFLFLFDCSKLVCPCRISTRATVLTNDSLDVQLCLALL